MKYKETTTVIEKDAEGNIVKETTTTIEREYNSYTLPNFPVLQPLTAPNNVPYTITQPYTPNVSPLTPYLSDWNKTTCSVSTNQNPSMMSWN